MSGFAIPRRQTNGAQTVALVGRMGRESVITTHNFCDRTTWYSASGRLEDVPLVDSGDGLTWTGGGCSWVDMTHGKLFDEDAIAADVPYGYAVTVKADGVVLAERAPFAASGGDYVVDYRAGTVTFAVSQAGRAVTASYSRVLGSTFVLAPAPGSRLDIEKVEAQFTTDVGMNDTIAFEIWAYNPYDPPNKVMVSRTRYKRFANLIDEALGSYPVVPAIGGSERGTWQAVYGFPFRYGTIRSMSSAQGVELRVRLEGDREFGGEHATATFYTTVQADT